MIFDRVKSLHTYSGAMVQSVLAMLALSVFSWDSDVVNVSRAIGCGWQELACIRCVLQTSPAQQPITLPSYRNCHSD